MSNSKQLRKILDFAISTVSNSPSIFVMNPEKDFTRDRKLNFNTSLRNVIYMESGSLKDELLKLNDHSEFTPTASAFIQSRSKIKHDAFKSIFEIFNKKSKILKKLFIIIFDFLFLFQLFDNEPGRKQCQQKQQL